MITPALIAGPIQGVSLCYRLAADLLITARLQGTKRPRPVITRLIVVSKEVT